MGLESVLSDLTFQLQELKSLALQNHSELEMKWSISIQFWTAIIKISYTKQLKQQRFNSHSSGGQEVHVLEDLVSGEVWLLAYRQIPSCCIPTCRKGCGVVGREGEGRGKEEGKLSCLLLKVTNPIMRASSSCPNYLPKVPTPNKITSEIRVSPINMGGVGTSMKPITFHHWTPKIHALLPCQIHSLHPNTLKSLNSIQHQF